MHNTSDCRKYVKNSKLKKRFGTGQHGNTVLDKKTASTFAQLSAEVESLEKANKKLKKSSKKHKHEYDSDSSDSDSSGWGGSGNTWGHNCSKPQLDKYTTPCPSIATNSLLSSLNTELMDARNNPKQQSLKRTRSESDNFDNILSPTQENLGTNWITAQASESNDDT